ncbi:MAG: hypothetical protein HY257_03090 [Chloroflexi bacterium]|nr:hypothetical protein [Chloroflexota bacterium]
MIAYKTYITIENPKQITLTDLPFRQGQRVEIVMIAEEEQAARLKEWQALFQNTQELPQAKKISEEDIAAEIASYRMGK